MKTCKELYQVENYTKEKAQILIGCYYNHIKEAQLVEGMSYSHEYSSVEIRIIKEFYFDDRRLWRLATVWYEGKPVMVIQNAGREGDDHYDRFITDKPLFNAMCRYIEEISNELEEEDMSDVYSEEEEIGEHLLSFYGNHLHGCFETY